MPEVRTVQAFKQSISTMIVRVFIAPFNTQQHHSLQDYVETSAMLQVHPKGNLGSPSKTAGSSS